LHFELSNGARHEARYFEPVLDGVAIQQSSRSNIKGVRKWSIDGEKCFGYWVSQNSDCAICLRVCPYNKDYSHWWVRAGRRLAGTRLRRLMLWLDIRLGFGERMRPRRWWQGGGGLIRHAGLARISAGGVRLLAGIEELAMGL